MLTVQDLSFSYPGADPLFSNLHFTLQDNDKASIIGNNGSGKSTLLKLICGLLTPDAGHVLSSQEPYYVPQLFGQFNHFTVAQAMKVAKKISALRRILSGHVSETTMSDLEDDWTIEERCMTALQYWQLDDVTLDQSMDTLSGGQKTKVFLAGINVHQPRFVLLDEPTNHLDTPARQLLYDFVTAFKGSMLIVSHDRQLLNCITTTAEIGPGGIRMYGGDYDFYLAQKSIDQLALQDSVREQAKSLRKATEKNRETRERQQRQEARGRKKQDKAGTPTIMLNTLRNKAQNSTAKLKDVHAEKIQSIERDLQDLRSRLPALDKMRIGLQDTDLHTGKLLFDARSANVHFQEKRLWKTGIDFQIYSGNRIALKGRNGSGKTTLIKMIIGEIVPGEGHIARASFVAFYIDQEYSVLDNQKTVCQQASDYSDSGLQEHEVKIILTRFLFDASAWDKPCGSLSGGERMRLVLCCLSLAKQKPDMIILDEPTNNLDIQNVEILAGAIRDYRGTVIAVSHDERFLHEIGIDTEYTLDQPK